jgi:hypothetical protein
MGEVLLLGLLGLSAFLQLLPGILPHWLEHSVAYPATLLLGLRHDQRLLDQPPKDLEHVLSDDAP